MRNPTYIEHFSKRKQFRLYYEEGADHFFIERYADKATVIVKESGLAVDQIPFMLTCVSDLELGALYFNESPQDRQFYEDESNYFFGIFNERLCI